MSAETATPGARRPHRAPRRRPRHHAQPARGRATRSTRALAKGVAAALDAARRRPRARGRRHHRRGRRLLRRHGPQGVRDRRAPVTSRAAASPGIAAAQLAQAADRRDRGLRRGRRAGGRAGLRPDRRRARGAKLGIPEVKRSLVAAGGALIRLPKRIPYHVAMELALTGDPMQRRARARARVWSTASPTPGGALDAALELAGRSPRTRRWRWSPPRRSSQHPATGPRRRPGPSRARSSAPVLPRRTPRRAPRPSRRSATRCGRGK